LLGFVSHDAVLVVCHLLPAIGGNGQTVARKQLDPQALPVRPGTFPGIGPLVVPRRAVKSYSCYLGSLDGSSPAAARPGLHPELAGGFFQTARQFT
jgi:hypothetical protein